MTKPKSADILKELNSSYGHIVNSKRRVELKFADFLYRIANSRKIKALQNWSQSALKFEEGVLQSYDRMAGVYNTENERLFDDDKVIFCKHNKEYAYLEMKDIYEKQISYMINNIFRPLLKDGMHILEVGAGETTTVHNLIKGLAPLSAHWSALELSWSRIAEGKRWATEHNTMNHFDTFVAASALNIPFADGTFDVVFTNGCIEQIRYGTEKAVAEILRVSKGLIILYEPTYELGDKYQRMYLDSAQYCRGVPDILKKLGVKVTRYELTPHSVNPFCCYSITVIEKDEASKNSGVSPKELCCPKCKSILKSVPDGLYCTSFECSCIYPVIWGIPCLRTEDAVFASKYQEMLTGQTKSKKAA